MSDATRVSAADAALGQRTNGPTNTATPLTTRRRSLLLHDNDEVARNPRHHHDHCALLGEQWFLRALRVLDCAAKESRELDAHR